MTKEKNKRTMSLFCNLSDPNTHGRYLADLVVVGGVQIETLANEGQQVTFQSWSAAVRKATAGWKAPPENSQLDWLWEVLTTEPTICRELGTQIRYLEDEWKDQKPVIVLNRGQELGLFLKPFRSFGGPVFPVPPGAEPDGKITLLGTLMMGPGKAASRRFECEDVEARVDIRVAKASSPEQEAILMKLERGRVDVKGNTVTASVRSLNHAFTVSSRRLQPHRRSHGGRIYDHIAWRDNNHWVSLEDIRREVEAGRWTPK